MSQAEQLQKLLLAARQAVKAGEAPRALALLEAALRIDTRSALAWFTAGQARAALGEAAAAADAFRRCTELTAHASPGTQLHALHQTAADNLVLESEAVLPPNWIAALHDAPRLAALQAGIAAAVQQAAQRSGGGGGSTQPPRVLVCGGLGLEAALAAQAGAAHVALLCQDNPLAARLAAQLAADSGWADRLTTATSAAQLGAEAPDCYGLVILADALGSSIDWALLQRQLAAVAALLAERSGGSSSGDSSGCYDGSPIVLPHAVHVCGQLVESAEAVALNEVDVARLAADTGGLDMSAANQLLPRARRSAQLPAYRHTALSSPATLLSVPLASLLLGGSTGSTGSDLEAGASLAVTAAGSADVLCWWLEQRLVAGGPSEQQGQALLLSSAPSSCSAQEAVLHPHVWQHLEFLDRRPLAAGQAVDVRCWLVGSSGSGSAAEVVAGSLQALSSEDAPASSKVASTSGTRLRFSVQLQGGGSSSDKGSLGLLLPVSAEQAAVAAAVPQYHISMLNDSPRTVAYRDGIAAAMREANAKAAARAGGGQEACPPLVLEIGSGSGLLLLLARQAGASRIIGCERLPELQQVAARLLGANGAAHSVAVLPKHSRALTVAEGGSSGSAGEEAEGGSSTTADLLRRAQVLLHEIFGSDPFSEGVVPSLLHTRQHLLAPGAVLAPCKLHVVAAVAASATHARLLRPPAAVCGGAVRTQALAQLAPRKADCQAGKAGGLYLLTEPAPVLSVDFAADELALADSATALLECLPRPVSLPAWVAAQQRQQSGGATAGDGLLVAAAPGSLDGAGGSSPPPTANSSSLFAVSWFEYEFPGGVRGSTAPHLQRSEHWQQVVQPLEGPVAEAALAGLLGGYSAGGSSGSGGGGGSDAGGASSGSSGSEPSVAALLLTAGYRVDRLWFELAGIAAAAGSDEEEEEEEEEDSEEGSALEECPTAHAGGGPNNDQHAMIQT